MGGKTEYYKGELSLSGIEKIIYELSGGDAVKAGAIKMLPLKKVYTYYYLNRLNELNMMLTAVSRMEEMKGE